MITIRRATLEDLPWLLEQLRAFAEFFGTRHSLFPSEMNAEHQLLQLMDPDVGCFFVAERPAEIGVRQWVTENLDGAAQTPATRLGFIVGALHPHLYNRAIAQLTEMFWWVAPEYRGSSAGARLLAAFEAYGREHADWIVMTLEAKSQIDPRSLERRGFRLQETSYLLEVSHA